ncbi:hypothetical protein A7978_05280 (plasmid) [Borrelia turicatae]|uniref:Uncharacterized protein n=1 Tax=Borrelia turicatae TaxID=142 RepID=A0A172XDH4_BORTU|nr:hypothetical protein A7978_05280 [Borrelia turicatae]
MFWKITNNIILLCLKMLRFYNVSSIKGKRRVFIKFIFLLIVCSCSCNFCNNFLLYGIRVFIDIDWDNKLLFLVNM